MTQAQYEAVTGKNPTRFSAEGVYKDRVKGMDTSRFPVETVSWEDAVAFCESVGKKTGRKVCLPREAEWEYACRAGTTTPFHFGGRLSGDLANCNGDYPYGTDTKGTNHGRTAQVGSYPANPWGLYDMHGNVYQWCEDYYGPYKYLKDRDPARPEKDKEDLRVLRGGSWNYYPRDCRAAYRRRSVPGDRDDDVGFRLCFRLD